jgi:arylformamidase
MKLTLNTHEYDLARPLDISIPLRFNGPQPNAYGVEPASSKACEYGTLVGDTRRGGSCNFEQYTFIPHCNGTHTECVGHITKERISIRDCLTDVLIPAHLISVEPVAADKTNEHYSVEFGSDDRLITKAILTDALRSEPPASAGGQTSTPANADLRTAAPPPTHAGGSAFIVRTSPNDDSKLTRTYDGSNIPPYFTTEAIQYIAELGCKHLLVDVPSIDRLFDEGKLLNHRIFWNVDEGSFDVNPETRIPNTITEMVYVPSDVPDGKYLLNLQIAPFASDCSPSRPVLFSKY